MTARQHPQDDPRPPIHPSGVARRAAVAAAWSAPVIAAAVAAPGASASPVAAGAFAGVSIGVGAGDGRFVVLVLLTTTATTTATDLVFGEDVRVDITAEHDVASWGEGVVVDGPRAGHVSIPAGSHPITSTYQTEGRLAAVARRAFFCRLTASPTGSFAVSAAVTRGPLYGGSDPIVKSVYGSPSFRGTVTI
ncbi:hypothetical protein [Rathayibacter festucae]|uniref:Uncharacterized protein n=2 Tax=Rathayibacter festucae TaxID=110937 RepID=A0A3Q9UY67_9MICO|nr:hypothetical protein [Rathayibacter festucae]AZZ52100.1 hypothetical protein C1I64_08540 [Rathayibacter festucae DSM 15932]MCJ1700619.1 hypothetical protein [Rathayibacter festucae]QHC62527.1 hypothetical protein GSU69_07460 [Rathayibacter festucae]